MENEDGHIPSFETAIVKLDQVETERIPQTGELDLEDKHLPESLRLAGTDEALKHWKNILAGIDAYAVFASTAMYLHGKSENIPELTISPGDFDVVTLDRQTLDRIHERLSNVPGIEWQNEGKQKQLTGEDGTVLKGWLRFALQVEGEPRIFRQKFEFFYKSRMIDDATLAMRTNIEGFKVLTHEGLSRQYLENLKYETKKVDKINNIIEYLSQPQTQDLSHSLRDWMSHDGAEPFVPDKLLAETLQQFDLTKEKLADVLTAMQERGGHDREWLVNKLAKLFTEHETKLPKRQKNVQELKDILRLEI